MSISTFSPHLENLSKAVETLETLDYPIGKLRAIYTEIYVAHELYKFSPQIGYGRKSHGADIYLPGLMKRVEVKGVEKDVFSGSADYAWAIGPNQLKDHKFDYCVLVGYKRGLLVAKVFVLTYEDFEEDYTNGKFHNPSFVRNLAGLSYGENFIGETPLERKMHDHPENYESRWDKISS
ncbi:MAG: hypothetical protein ACREBS_00485 [Nitrososphaerales archaeon]